MKRYVALLRGINGGGNNKVLMADLRDLFLSLGYEDVKTYINSGNVLFTSKNKDFSKLGTKISKKFGFPVPTIVVEQSLLERVVKEVPDDWENDKVFKTDILFFWEPYQSKKVIEELEPTEFDEMLYIKGGLLAWRVHRDNQNKSRMQKGFIGSKVYKHMTARNINTARKLVSLLNSE